MIILDLISAEESKHLTTFPALNFIQNGKIDKKFSIFGKDFAFVIETGGNVYCYAKPRELDQKTSPQYLVQLDEEVYGWAYEIDGKDEVLFILSKEKIYKLTITMK